jgi:hypothetical protein
MPRVMTPIGESLQYQHQEQTLHTALIGPKCGLEFRNYLDHPLGWVEDQDILMPVKVGTREEAEWLLEEAVQAVRMLDAISSSKPHLKENPK